MLRDDPFRSSHGAALEAEALRSAISERAQRHFDFVARDDIADIEVVEGNDLPSEAPVSQEAREDTVSIRDGEAICRS